jgi:2-C-methyl-D-erythritol 4-phosphate cytidylyltransferase/2-C-methyl-D-erythritol 2,4-cyclodiphosphate synthase
VKSRVAAIIVAAGQSSRFGSPKVLSSIGGDAVIARVVSVFQSAPGIDRIVVVVSGVLRDEVTSAIRTTGGLPSVEVVDGGERRQDSVLAGVLVADDATIVVVHDAARPLVTAEMISGSIEAVEAGADAAVAAIPVSDTIKRVTGDAVETIDRANLWRAQTPQAFRRDALLRELEHALRDGIEVTDEATLIERAGGRVTLVPGSERNMKLTGPDDRAVLEALLSTSAETFNPEPLYRTGTGYDVHRLVPGRALVLGGVEIPSDVGLDGHSDADVLLHAVCDALLGSCALGDIGYHFPPTDPRFRGISSLTLLERVHDLVAERGYSIGNIDATVVAEAPMIGPHIPAMQHAIANALTVSPDRVGIKATTSEGLGFAGRREGIAAMAVATVSKTR